MLNVWNEADWLSYLSICVCVSLYVSSDDHTCTPEECMISAIPVGLLTWVDYHHIAYECVDASFCQFANQRESMWRSPNVCYTHTRAFDMQRTHRYICGKEQHQVESQLKSNTFVIDRHAVYDVMCNIATTHTKTELHEMQTSFCMFTHGIVDFLVAT